MGLFTPKWIEDPEETKKLTDQRKLQKAFAKAHHPGVLKAAGWRIEDQAFLVDILEHSRVRFVDTLRWELLGRITRPELLEHIINTNYNDGSGFDFLDRQVAIRKVKDPALLTRIALEDEWPDNRMVAVQCLTDLDALRRVASESRDSNLREKAAAIVKANEPKKAEPPRPAAPVKKAPRPNKPQEAPEDDAALIERFEAADDPETRLDALKRVRDEAFHAKVARGDCDPALRAAAVNHLRDQALLADIFRSAGDGEVARAALKKLTDQALLAEVARGDLCEETRGLAISRLNDAGALADLALDEAQPEALHQAALEKLMKLKDVAALERVLAGLPDGIERTNVAGAVKSLGSHAADDYIARQRVLSDAARLKKLDEYHAARRIGGAKTTPADGVPKPAPQPRATGGYNALSGPAAAEYVNKLSPRQLMELILFGENGQEANNIVWLCNRLAAKMMIPHETGDRATIEMFFLAFSGVPTRNHYRAMTGFWPPNQAEAAFTQTMLQFAALPKSLRDIHARLYLEHYGRL